MTMNSYFTRVRRTELNHFSEYSFLIKYFKDIRMDCDYEKTYEVDKDTILKLINTCKHVLDDNSLAGKLLPVMNVQTCLMKKNMEKNILRN